MVISPCNRRSFSRASGVTHFRDTRYTRITIDVRRLGIVRDNKYNENHSISQISETHPVNSIKRNSAGRDVDKTERKYGGVSHERGFDA